MQPLVVRPYRPADEVAVIALWHACELTRPWNDPAKDIARKQRVQPELFLVGTHDDRVVATVMIGYEGHRGWINYLAVDPAYRRAGHARRLMNEAEKRLLELGCPKINLQLRKTNAQALGFYRALGYVEDEALSLGKRLIPDR
jgi:ribosomal protein S18 acetylase RimI-like enzyme